MSEDTIFCPFCTRPVKGDIGLTSHCHQMHRDAMRQLRMIAPYMPLETWEYERDLLKEEIALLKREMYGADWVAPLELRLTSSQHAIVAAMVMNERVLSEEFLFDASRVRTSSADELNGKLICVMISHIRKKLRPYGLEIVTVYGRGYSLTPETRHRLLNWEERKGRAA
jgi:two-component system, cell cycle response regulator CtrA